MRKQTRYIIFAFIVSLACAGLIAMPKSVSAADGGEFSLQVSPSPLVTTLKPGQTTTVELKVRNAGSQTEKLKIAPRSFTINNTTGELKFDDTVVPQVASWTSFASPNFTVDPGQTFTEEVKFAVPKDAGFSYSFALVINRQNVSQTTDVAGRLLKGSIATFTLINIDRPGATRQLQIADFSTNQSIYEYLPAKLNIQLRNTGNTIVQPAGNVFIQRGSNDKVPINTLPVNQNNGYILPGSVRTLSVDWSDGFQVLHSVTAGDGTTSQQLSWDWSNLSHLRIGRYTAKLVAIYNDGQRDIPVMGEVSFWVIPWKLLLGALVVVGLLGGGLWSLVRAALRLSKGKKRIRF
jgi:hypothetical protein